MKKRSANYVTEALAARLTRERARESLRWRLRADHVYESACWIWRLGKESADEQRALVRAQFAKKPGNPWSTLPDRSPLLVETTGLLRIDRTFRPEDLDEFEVAMNIVLVRRSVAEGRPGLRALPRPSPPSFSRTCMHGPGKIRALRVGRAGLVLLSRYVDKEMNPYVTPIWRPGTICRICHRRFCGKPPTFLRDQCGSPFRKAMAITQLALQACWPKTRECGSSGCPGA